MTSDGGLDEGADPGVALYKVGGSSVAWSEAGGEIVVLDLTGTVYFGLNQTAAILWKQLTRGAHRRDLVTTVVAWGVDGARAADDVDQFLAALDGCGLLHGA